MSSPSRRADGWRIHVRAIFVAALASAGGLSACTPVPQAAPPAVTGVDTSLPSDWIARFSALPGELPAAQIAAEPATLPGDVSVLRLTVPEHVFFDTDSDRPHPESAAILAAIARDMGGSVPPLHVTVLGHTDAQGGDAYNLDLSRRRADRVAALLAADGVPPALLSTVAVGRRQPVASNDTAEGRARNRRVEFLVSPSESANLAIANGPGPLPESETVSQPLPPPPVLLRRRTAGAEPAGLAPASQRRQPAPAPRYTPSMPETYQPRTLGPAQSF